MARAKRSELERLVDQRFMTELFFQRGEKFDATQAAELINARRAASARSYAEGLGLDDEETEALVAESQVSAQTVRRDLRELKDRVRTAADLGGAGMLDAQMTRIESRLEMVDRQLIQVEEDEQALREDIQRSRTGSWQRISGTLVSDDDGVVKSQQPQKMMTHTDDGSADARLWDKYLKCNDKRERLLERESRLMRDQRLLLLGRQWFGGGTAQGEKTFAQMLTEAATPEAASDMVMARLAEEVDRIPYGDQVIGQMPADVARAHQAAVRSQVNRTRALTVLASTSRKRRDSLPSGGDSGGSAHVIELAVRQPTGTDG